MFKDDIELFCSLKENLDILKEDKEKILTKGDKKRLRVVSASLRILAADTHELSTKGLLRFFADKYEFKEDVIPGEDFNSYIDSNILFGSQRKISFISRRQLILSESQNDGLAHESKARYSDSQKNDGILASYRFWLEISGTTREIFLCKIASELSDYGTRLVKFLETRIYNQKESAAWSI